MYSPNVQILQMVVLVLHRSGQRIQIPRRGQSFYAKIIAILGMLLTAFTPLMQLMPPSQPLHAFKLSIYCLMMVLCATTLYADVSLRRGGRLNIYTRRWSQSLRTISILSSSLGIISLLSIIKPYIPLVLLPAWLLLATHLTCCLILNQPPILPVTINRGSNFTNTISESINTIFSMMQTWAINLFQQWTATILGIHRRNLFDRRISGTARGLVQLPV